MLIREELRYVEMGLCSGIGGNMLNQLEKLFAIYDSSYR